MNIKCPSGLKNYVQDNNGNSLITIFERDRNRNKKIFKSHCCQDVSYQRERSCPCPTVFVSCPRFNKLRSKKRNKFTVGYEDSAYRAVFQTAVRSCPCFYNLNQDQSGLVEDEARLAGKNTVRRILSHCNTRKEATMSKQGYSATNAKIVDKRANSWSRIFKEQNAGMVRDPKRTAAVAPTQNTKASVSNTKAPPGQQQRGSVAPPDRKEPRREPKMPDPIPVKEQILHQLERMKSSGRLTSGSRGTSVGTKSVLGSPVTSISGESVLMMDKSAQCSINSFGGFVNDRGPAEDPYHTTSDLNQAGDNGLAFFNPVRTLNFLVRELRGKVSEGSEDENILRIIRDMENTVSRLTKSTSLYSGVGNGRDSSWNTLISEADLKCVLELLQNVQKPKPMEKQISEAEKSTAELQTKLEETCGKLEEMCRLMERAASTRLKDEKDNLNAELNEKTTQLEAASTRERRYEETISELHLKNEEQKKLISQLKDTHNKYVALNSILSEQLQDAEKKNQQLTTEMQFLVLEKEKNLVLMKCKDNDLQEMRKNLEEIKDLVVQHFQSFRPGPLPAPEKTGMENRTEATFMTLMSAVDGGGPPRTGPLCSSPAVSTSPAPEEDESWRRVSGVPLAVADEPRPALAASKSRMLCIKESVKSLFKEMNRQAESGKLVQDLLRIDDPSAMSNWSNDSDNEDMVSGSIAYTLSDTASSVKVIP